jgi:3-hydroxybutyryl-CoA dehydrogenase
MMSDSDKIVAVIGAGTMGRGIAQIAAQMGYSVILCDSNEDVLRQAHEALDNILSKLESKGRLGNKTARDILGAIQFTPVLQAVKPARIVFEAIIEDLTVKKNLFSQLESLVDKDTILTSNTSSLSITSIASACQFPQRVVGCHFFNPAPLMPLVEIVPGLQTDSQTVEQTRTIIDNWQKIPVIAKDTPGFIVNRVARPFYGEALRIYEEGIADFASIDWAMTKLGGFRMGPFMLMDLIGNDINFTVTQTVYQSFFYDPRYKPSFTQQRLVEAGLLGRKTGRGYYDYRNGDVEVVSSIDENAGQQIVQRIVAMLINEAADALFWQIASRDDIDLAMTRGVNYPKGLLKWADEIGVSKVYQHIEELYQQYREDRYRPSPLLKRMAQAGQSFY